MPFIGNKPADSFTSFAKQDFTTSATTSYTLDYPVANANEIALFINFVRQEPTTAYTASGTTLTLSSATSATDDMYCVFLGKALQTVNPPNASVNLDKLDTTTKTFLTRNYRNIIINGDMSIAQRGTSESGITSNTYVVDRNQFRISGLGTWTVSQDTDVPTGQGFFNSMKMECTTADASPSANDFCIFNQIIEGQNLQHLKKGTSNAESLTMSFWVKSNKTGTYITQLWDNDNDRSISQSFTISVANTWEKKTLTFAGDTTGAFDNDNGASLYARVWLGSGSTFTSGTLNTSWNARVTADIAVGQVNLADSISNYINITGVQLEAGTTASDFEFLPYDVNLQRCQRYFENMDAFYPGFSAGTKGVDTGYTVIFKTTKRTTPTMSDVTLRNANSGNTTTVSASGSGWTFDSGARYNTSGTTGNTGDGMHIYASNGIHADAEL